jgi:hypothetical protein
MSRFNWSCRHLKNGDLQKLIDELGSEDKYYALALIASSNSLEGSCDLSFAGFEKLEMVALGFNKISALPPSLFEVSSLQNLNVTKNQLTKLPSLSKLVNLKTLVIADNKIAKLNEDIGALKNLTFLDVSKNQLVALPNQLCSCRKLTKLAAEDNNIKTLPFDFDYLSELSILRLRGNNLGAKTSENVSSQAGVRGLLESLVAPAACYKAIYAVVTIWRLRKTEVAKFGEIPRDVLKIITRMVLATKNSFRWVEANKRNKGK